MKTSARSTTKSSPVPSRNGGPPRPSVQAVAVRSTPTGLDCSRETVIVLTAFLYSLFGYTLSGDVMVLSALQAEQEAKKMGVSKEDFDRIKKAILENWLKNRNANPLSGMF